MMFKLDIRAIGKNDVKDNLGTGYGVRIKNVAVIIVLDDSICTYSGRSEYMFVNSVKDNGTHRISTNTLQKANEGNVVIVTLAEFVLLTRILLMLIQLLQNLLNL
jgi:hypothetical protein